MDYLHNQYSFGHGPELSQHTATPIPVQFAQHTQPQQIEYYHGLPTVEFNDFGQHTPINDDFEEGAEILTRPRLTKEQVEVLEAQFQAHPKPNSNVKRQLALQTKLTLPRVANWFQNRRAKAKQQKKQEEFEITQAIGLAEAWKSEGGLPQGYGPPLHLSTAVGVSRPQTATMTGESLQQSASPDMTSGRDSAQEASWASLQRALSAANAARSQFANEQLEPAFPSVPSQELSTPSYISSTNQGGLSQVSTFSDWSGSATSSGPWASSEHSEDHQFDFGFGHPGQFDAHHSLEASPQQMSAHPYSLSPDVWAHSVQTPTVAPHISHDGLELQHSKTMQLSIYPSSRRGSTSDELTTNFETFALVGTPPIPSPLATPDEDDYMKKSDNPLDLAARRKRPRPAALGTAALRSRSYGASPSISPSLKFAANPPALKAVRHVKSTGQNLNVRYSGIRKSSSGQRSPFNLNTFAEAEALNKLMTQQSFPSQKSSPAPPTPLSPETVVQGQLPVFDAAFYSEQESTPSQFHFDGQPVHFNMASPPNTPPKPELYQGQMPLKAPPISVPAQYALIPDYTPPYSAGPLTSSSWSDAPLASPELPAFPTTLHVPQPNYPIHDLGAGHFPHFSLAPETRADSMLSGNADLKPTEFFIQEFPRQKEEHAHAAQQLAQLKPKNYIFANATPSDF